MENVSDIKAGVTALNGWNHGYYRGADTALIHSPEKSITVISLTNELLLILHAKSAV